MRKFFSLALAVATAFCFLPTLAACKKELPRGAYRITAEYFPEECLLDAEMTVCAVNNGENARSELKFQLWPNAYREGAKYQPISDYFYAASYYDGASYGGIEITEVTGGAGYAVCGEDENVLAVTLFEPLYPDERTELTVKFRVTLPKVNHRLGAGERNVCLANFYPVLCTERGGAVAEYVYAPDGDPFVSDCADYTLALTVPEGYVAAYSGTGGSVTEGGKTTYRITAENVRDIAVVLGTELKCVSETVGDTEVAYYYLEDEKPAETLAIAGKSLACFSERFGGYEYPRYCVVETDLPFGGMEYPALTMLGILPESEKPWVIAHETAHQWWYAMVGSNQFENAWQDEGLAEYSALLFLEDHPEYGDASEAARNAENAYRAYFSITSQLGGANTVMNRPLTSYSGAYEYRSIAYDKGMILFDKVRMVVGDRRFGQALRSYCATYSGRIASPEELIACFERAGTTVEGLFASFTDGLAVI